ncbi:MAG: aminopeptidase P N-terminal domain-containing protein [Polyangiaceae bacterium]|nr:aminopeptidase P N-terminal domain-containing protein [Polyangiaceae bacterium]
MDLDTYRARRERVLDELNPGVLVLFGARSATQYGSSDDDRPEPDVRWLTGFEEPDCVVVLRSGAERRFTLFLRPRDPERETWDGPRLGPEGAIERLGADAAYPIGELAAKLPAELENVPRLFYRLGRDRVADDQVLAALDRVRARGRTGVQWPCEIIEPARVVHEQRLRKAPEEVALMRRAAEITTVAHVAAMARCAPGQHEYELEAVLRERFRASGSERPAYPPIVGSGPNATVLHYRRNDRRMSAGELVLIDAGCELHGYASDVTRTFPVDGRFTTAQQAIYELVLESQTAALDATRPGATIDEVHRVTVEVLARGMLALGLLRGSLAEVLEQERYKTFYMHRTSHFLGLDVHDVGAYFVEGRSRALEPGMTITIEPGLYVPVGADVPERFRGIGVRIEDDVLVTEQGAEVLTPAVPRTVADVERACRG